SVVSLPFVSTELTTKPPPWRPAFQDVGAPVSERLTRAGVVVFTETVKDAFVPGLTVMSGNCVVMVRPSAACRPGTSSGSSHIASAIESTPRRRREIKVVEPPVYVLALPRSGRGRSARRAIRSRRNTGVSAAPNLATNADLCNQARDEAGL